MTTHRITPHLYPSAAELELPGSKSEVNRLLVLAALSGHEVSIEGVSASDDVRYMVDGVAALGYFAQLDTEGRTIRVGPRQRGAPTSGEMFCGNAGTAVRFLVSLAAITPGNWTVTGDARMQTRPMQPLIDAWRQLGVVVTRDAKDLRVVGARPPPRARCARKCIVARADGACTRGARGWPWYASAPTKARGRAAWWRCPCAASTTLNRIRRPAWRPPRGAC